MSSRSHNRLRRRRIRGSALRRGALVAAAATTALVVGACGAGGDQPDPADAIEGGVIIFAADQEPPGFNYNTSKDSLIATRDVIVNLFYFAVKARPDGSLHFEGLAQEPEVLGQDPLHVEWTIHDDANWSDGTPVTTADIEFFYENMIDPDNDVFSRAGYDAIEKLEIVDDKTFQVTFGTVYADFRALWQAIPQAAHVQEQSGGWNTGLDEHPGPSAGPYLFESRQRGVSLTLAPNPHWQLGPEPTLDRLVFRYLPEGVAVVDALRNGEVHLINLQAQQDLQAQLASLPHVTTEVLWRPAFEHLVLNVAHPVVGDLAVRQAIAHAMDRNEIVEAMVRPFSADAERLDNVVYTDVTAANYEPTGAPYAEVDLAEAARVLDEAGWQMGPDGVRVKDGTRLSIALDTTAGNQRREDTVAMIQAQLAQVGIEAVISTYPATELFSERLPAGNFEVVLKAFSASPFPIADAQARFVTGGGDNYGQFSDPEVDRLADQAARALDPAEQAQLGNAMAERLWEGLTMIPIHQLPNLVAYENTIVGVEPNGTRDGLFWNSAAWGRVAP